MSQEVPTRSNLNADLLARYTSEAQALERRGQFKAAIERWQQAIKTLPGDSAQAVMLREHIHALESAHPEAQSNRWIRRLGPLAPIALFFAKFKFILVALLKFKFIFSLLAFFGFYWALYGPRFGIGFALLVLIHEMGHYIEVKRRGLPADMPVFLPGIGAYVRWQNLGVTVEVRSIISLAGPFAGLLASAACAAIWWQQGGSNGAITSANNIWIVLAAIGAWLNALNLIPVFILDGGQAILALNRNARIALTVIAAAIGYITSQWTFYLVAAGTLYRVFTAMRQGDEPATSSPKILFYYTALLCSLALLLHILPNHGALNR